MSLFVVAGCVLLICACLAAGQATDIGSRLELLVDDHLIDHMTGARLQLHHPMPREVVMTCDEPWEGNASGYHSIFRDGDIYRMYYKAQQIDVRDGVLEDRPHPLFTCYAQSPDGVHWTRPKLGGVEFEGSRENNIVLGPTTIGGVMLDPGHATVFRDDNPDCPAASKYKAIIRSLGPLGEHSPAAPQDYGLFVFHSADGLHWQAASQRPIVAQGSLDSQNLAFWDATAGRYRLYYRLGIDGKRQIATATSVDFVRWSQPQILEYPGAPPEQLYTSQIKPYPRAPHIFIGFPTRYIERGWSQSMSELPDPEHRRLRASAGERYGTALTEALLMSSRDGRTFHRWPEAFLRPGPERSGTWLYGSQYLAWHAVETAPLLEGGAPELSLYATENYWIGAGSRVRRYALRLDGFVSASAPLAGGELLTKPVVFDGDRLVINFSSSAAGSVRIELQDEAGQAIPGYALDNCDELFGDSVDRTVSWQGGEGVRKLAGQPVRLRIELRDADLYALRFAPTD